MAVAYPAARIFGGRRSNPKAASAEKTAPVLTRLKMTKTVPRRSAGAESAMPLTRPMVTMGVRS